jgi:hypothetical protein
MLLIGALFAIAGCGGDSAHTTDGTTAATPPPRLSSDARVVRSWAETLRKGDVRGAAGYFTVPSIAQNGTPPLKLRTPDAVLAFNAALPCGAVLIRTQRRGRYLVGVFRLTNRPGGDCGPGVGGEAATAFRIRAGKIAVWRRVAVPPVQQQRKSPDV